MSSIFYRFRSSSEQKTYVFDESGLQLEILAYDLQMALCKLEGLMSDSVNLLLMNSQTKSQYSPDDLIPRNVSIIVQRVPATGARKPRNEKLRPQMRYSPGTTASENTAAGDVKPPDTVPMLKGLSEDERIDRILAESSVKYNFKTTMRGRSPTLSLPPPPTYLCYRCSIPGHWVQRCPLEKVRRAKGLRLDEMVSVDANDPHALLHSSGSFGVPIVDYKARLRLAEPGGGKSPAGQPSVAAVPKSRNQIPEELKCTICEGLVELAMVTICCGNSYCGDCLLRRMLEYQTCPSDACRSMLVSENIAPNMKLRTLIEEYKNSGSFYGRSTEEEDLNNSSLTKDGSLESQSTQPSDDSRSSERGTGVLCDGNCERRKRTHSERDDYGRDRSCKAGRTLLSDVHMPVFVGTPIPLYEFISECDFSLLRQDGTLERLRKRSLMDGGFFHRRHSGDRGRRCPVAQDIPRCPLRCLHLQGRPQTDPCATLSSCDTHRNATIRYETMQRDDKREDEKSPESPRHHHRRKKKPRTADKKGDREKRGAHRHRKSHHSANHKHEGHHKEHKKARKEGRDDRSA